ncbi:MAG: PAS domain S-box protein [Candidatus Electryonea clarkiae]|nr:PAS domain S-box protein [Candidatus Electryonea clarkiae]
MDILENKDSREELNIFQQLSERISVTLDPEQVASALFDIIKSLISIKQIGLYIFSGSPSDFIPVGSESLDLLDQALSLREEGVVDWVFDQKQPVFTQSHSSLKGKREDDSEILLIPLIVGDKRVGILFASSNISSDKVNQYKLTLVYLASYQAAVAIKHAYDYVESERSKAYLSKILENVNDIIYSTDAAGIVTFVNSRVDVFGFKPERLIGQPVYTLIPIDLDEGRTVEVLNNGKSFAFDAEFETVKGKKSFSINIVPLKESRNKTNGCLGIMRDITLRTQFEKELSRRKRLEALAEAAVSINHEMNNPLTVIKGNMYLLENLFPLQDYPDAMDMLKIIEKHVERICEVVKKFERVNEMGTVEYPGGLKMLDINSNMDSSDKQNDAESSSIDNDNDIY